MLKLLQVTYLTHMFYCPYTEVKKKKNLTYFVPSPTPSLNQMPYKPFWKAF